MPPAPACAAATRLRKGRSTSTRTGRQACRETGVCREKQAGQKMAGKCAVRAIASYTIHICQLGCCPEGTCPSLRLGQVAPSSFEVTPRHVVSLRAAMPIHGSGPIRSVSGGLVVCSHGIRATGTRPQHEGLCGTATTHCGQPGRLESQGVPHWSRCCPHALCWPALTRHSSSVLLLLQQSSTRRKSATAQQQASMCMIDCLPRSIVDSSWQPVAGSCLLFPSTRQECQLRAGIL